MNMKSMVWYLSLLAGITLFSCRQDPIFFSISQEVEPREPRIKGTPTALVEVDNTVYVTSRFSETIYQYNGGWSSLPQPPGGRILELAGTESNLYALTGDPGSTQIFKYTDSTWDGVSLSANIQSIYGAGEYIFAGVMTGGGKFAISYKEKDRTELKTLKLETGFLTGAAYDGGTYYLATAGDGLYTFDGTTPPQQVNNSAGLTMMGIIMVKDQAAAVSRDGKILYGKDGTFEVKDTGVTFTGALGLWEKDNLHLLLLGVQGSSTSNGYREIVLNNDGTLNPAGMGLNSPGNDKEKSSLTNTDKYNASLGKKALAALLQAPDGVLFAATVKDGLWSYRNDEWNGED